MQPSTVVLLVMLGYIIVLMAGWLPFSIANALMAVAMSFFVEEFRSQISTPDSQIPHYL